MAKRKRAGIGRHHRIRRAKTAEKKAKKLQTQLKDLSKHLTMMASDPHT